MSVKSALLKVYYLPFLSKEKANINQKKIRDEEWNAIKSYIPVNSKFLDVGCGAGYAMKKATEEFNCNCRGIDPDPGAHGVGRYEENFFSGMDITKATAENIPFNDESFDVVYSSHVLEHVTDEVKSLEEMKRVLKSNGTLIIGMPTAAMAWINFITALLFTTHMRFVNFFLSPFITTGKTKFINLLIPESHSAPRAKTIFYDLSHYRVSNWNRIVSGIFKIERTFLPALYPYPEYRQLFGMRKDSKFSSSVFFICKKV
jgi:ubiquinone/menaquinone biosynthesis C-methylase UbiE